MDSWIPLKNIERYLTLLVQTESPSECAILRELIEVERGKLIEPGGDGEGIGITSEKISHMLAHAACLPADVKAGDRRSPPVGPKRVEPAWMISPSKRRSSNRGGGRGRRVWACPLQARDVVADDEHFIDEGQTATAADGP